MSQDGLLLLPGEGLPPGFKFQVGGCACGFLAAAAEARPEPSRRAFLPDAALRARPDNRGHRRAEIPATPAAPLAGWSRGQAHASLSRCCAATSGRMSRPQVGAFGAAVKEFRARSSQASPTSRCPRAARRRRSVQLMGNGFFLFGLSASAWLQPASPCCAIRRHLDVAGSEGVGRVTTWDPIASSRRRGGGHRGSRQSTAVDPSIPGRTGGLQARCARLALTARLRQCRGQAAAAETFGRPLRSGFEQSGGLQKSPHRR